ncbi:MAG: glycosyltransferase family 1 protein [Opitutaceae bacterium]|nr:glycosyltransferase family 1 protein [Opitutaceae bacterium]
MSDRALRLGYVGTLDPGGTCHSRLEALRSVEPQVTALDTDEFLQGGRLARWLNRVPGVGAGPRRLNAAVLRFAREARLDLLWIDKGDWVAPATLRALRAGGVRLAHHVTDALWPQPVRLRLTRRRLAATAPLYDHYLTSNAADFRRLQGAMGGRVLLTQLGYDERRFHTRPGPDRDAAARWAHDAIFVGHWEPRTERGLAALIDARVRVKIFGRAWLARARRNPRLAGHVFDGLGDRDYELALKHALVGLCFVSEWNYNETAGRSYEIPASGTFLLAPRTREHQRDYREGEEAEFFGSEAELVAKARHYLVDDDARRAVAARGHRRCTTSGYSWRAIMLRDWERVRVQVAPRGVAP